MAKFCRNCGAKLASEEQFCPNCGTPVEQEETEPSEKTAAKETAASIGRYNKALIAVIVMLVLIIGGLVLKETVSDGSMQTAATESSSDSSSKKPKHTELFIGGLEMRKDMTMDDVRKEIGKETSMKDRKSFLSYQYDGFDVNVQNGKVSAILVRDPAIETKRGIHVGSTEIDMHQAYGTDHDAYGEDEMAIYEYTFQMVDGEPGILRFGIDRTNKKVDFISVYPASEKKEKANR